MRAEALRLIKVFDAKPLKRKCLGRNCQKQAVKFTAYVGNPFMLYKWCNTCDPYQAGAIKGKLMELKTYREALEHIELTCGGVRASYKAIIREMALAKGLPERSGDKQVDAFFA